MTQKPSSNYEVATAVLIGTVITLIVVIGLIFAQINVTNAGNVGVVKTINCAAYTDTAASKPLTSISWGTLSPDSSMNYTFYMKNMGNSPCNWTFTESAWSPTNANTYIYAGIDFLGAVNTPPGGVIPVVATDSVLANAPVNTSYGYTTTIAASG